MEEQKPIQWEAVEPNVWKPENAGDSISGVLVSKKENIGVNNSRAYYLDSKPNGTFMVWGSTVLDDRMSVVNEGEVVRITYKGTQPNQRGQDTKIFHVERAKNLVGDTPTNTNNNEEEVVEN